MTTLTFRSQWKVGLRKIAQSAWQNVFFYKFHSDYHMTIVFMPLIFKYEKLKNLSDVFELIDWPWSIASCWLIKKIKMKSHYFALKLLRGMQQTNRSQKKIYNPTLHKTNNECQTSKFRFFSNVFFYLKILINAIVDIFRWWLC